MRTFLLACGCSFIVGLLQAQHHQTFGGYGAFLLTYKLADRWQLDSYTFLTERLSEGTQDGLFYPAQTTAFYSELDLTYLVTRRFSLTGSYTYERADPFTENYRNEHRGWLQAQHVAALNDKLNLKNRLRYDARFITFRSNLDGVWSEDTQYQPRVRYLLGIDRPLTDRIKLVVFDEVFFNTFSEAAATFGENWGFAGVHLRLTRRATIETGYLNIAWVRNANKDWLIQHYFNLSLFLNLSPSERL